MESAQKMQVVHDISQLRIARAQMAGTFGLVPTMGALHEGHASLVRRAGQECDCVGVSIFVNPSQFAPGEDLEKYPRTLEKDLALLEDLGVDLVFNPAMSGIYAPGYQTWITVEDVAAQLEGQARPGHFRGVATIVAKLFHCFQPDRAYFGQKDAQQVAVIRRMVTDLNFPLDVVVCPTVREPDGLAMSSRNAYLGPDERKAAAVLYRALVSAREKYEKGERAGNALRAVMQSVIDAEPLARADYVSVSDPGTLREIEALDSGQGALLSMAVRIGKTRLIDNLLL